MGISNRLKNQHLLWRAAFGPDTEFTASPDSLSTAERWKRMKASSSGAPEKIEVTGNPVSEKYRNMNDLEAMRELKNDKELQKKIREQSRGDMKELNIRWLNAMISSRSQLREKMSLFWHGHFACRVINSYFQQELLHTIRTNALGNFGDLLKAVSKSPAMLQFLNNQQNRKSHPNENFAREVMELFTMGRGNYTEDDVKEAARAFTGWGFNIQGTFMARNQQHDNGTKVFLGKTGNFNGDDILDMLLQQPQTARFICRKLYRYLVNDLVDENNVKWLGDRFYKNNYDISKLLDDIFTADWFYQQKNIGTRIKSPIELLAGIRRFLPLEPDNENTQLLIQKVLGQVLFFPPNVAGWPGGKNWIDSSTLMVRLQLPKFFSAKEPINIQPKQDDDVSMGQLAEEIAARKKNKEIIRRGASADIDWAPVCKVFDNVKRENLFDAICNALLQAKSSVPSAVMEKYSNSGSREDYIRSTVINIMSTPEYQLC